MRVGDKSMPTKKNKPENRIADRRKKHQEYEGENKRTSRRRVDGYEDLYNEQLTENKKLRSELEVAQKDYMRLLKEKEASQIPKSEQVIYSLSVWVSLCIILSLLGLSAAL